jgi:hypothetical protein
MPANGRWEIIQRLKGSYLLNVKPILGKLSNSRIFLGIDKCKVTEDSKVPSL